MARVLIAPDKFKGSLSAAEVAAAVARGIRRTLPRADVDTLPVADGGDGTVAAALAAGFARVDVTATGPTGELVRTGYARRGRHGGGRGRGHLRAAAASRRADRTAHGHVVRHGRSDRRRRRRRLPAHRLGIGGSATTDGGAGMLQALGARLADGKGNEIGRGGIGLGTLAAIDLAPLRRRMSGVRVRVACDVDNPLCGARGAAAVYGPQKGATPGQVELLDQLLGRYADVVAATAGADHRDAPGAGAAGGIGFALVSLLERRALVGHRAGASTSPGSRRASTASTSW